MKRTHSYHTEMEGRIGPNRAAGLRRQVLLIIVLSICFFWADAIIVRANGKVANTSKPNKVSKTRAKEDYPNKTKAPETLTQADIIKKIEDLQKRIQVAQKAENEQTAQQMGVKLTDLNERTGKLGAIQSAYERLLTALKKRPSLAEEETLLREKLKIGQHISEKPPYSLSFYDSLLDELAIAEQQMQAAGVAVKLSEKSLGYASLKLEDTQKEWRSFSEKLTAMPEKTRSQKRKWDLGKATLELERREAFVRLEKANYDNLLAQFKIGGLRAEAARQKTALIKTQLQFDESDLKKQLDSIVKVRTELKERVQELTQGWNNTREAWLSAQRQSAEASDKGTDPAKEAFLIEREAWHRTYQAVLEQTEDRLHLLEHQEKLWRLRHAIIKDSIQSQELANQKKMVKNHIKNINRVLNLQQSYQAILRSEILAIEKKVSEKGLDKSVSEHLENQVQALQKLAERRFEYTSALLATGQLDQRVLDEIDSRLGQTSVEQGLTELKGQVQKVWDFEVWVIDNQSVTVRKLIVALSILIVGILVAKYFLRAIGKRLFSFTHIKETTASAIEKILIYFAYLLILLFALRMVNIPLGAFAFLGGAIAIGVGFGAQNLINNFISGFIMMAERPISIGDLIELEGILGKVEEIGARCTRIRTGENIHILVPNSSFLEKNITNWTLSDHKIKAKITVGIVYGSPVREAERLLLKAVTESEKVLDTPEPFVLFSDFGNNALVFEVYFWIIVRQVVERRVIESQVRYRIDELFREAKIVIAFPQRDVHLDTQRPLEFRLVDKKD